MDNDKVRIAIAAVLCTAIFFAWQFLFPPVREVSKTNSALKPIFKEESNQKENTVIYQETAQNKKEPLIIENQDVTVAFDKNTGDIIYAKMKKYAYKVGDQITFENKLSNTNYAVIGAGLLDGFKSTVSEVDDYTFVTFTATNSQIEVTKSYQIPSNDFRIPIILSISNLTSTPVNVPISLKVGPGLGEGFDKASYVFAGAISGDGKKIIKKKIGAKVKKGEEILSPKWGGYTSKYFLFSFMGGEFEKSNITAFTDTVPLTELTKVVTVPANSQEDIHDLSLYIGPKLYNKLKSYDNGIHKTIEYGMFWFIAVPMKSVLTIVYNVVHNYGVAIIILTIIVKIITLPLTLKSTISMKNMSKLQPEILKLREKYKGEPTKLNAATLELYKVNKVNPMSGCLPMLIQLPIFIALYRTLLVSIELKDASFIAWLKDLSAADPTYITPILMGISMFITQKMTPSAGDPMQKKMMMMMPVIFTFMFLKMPSGLVLYWLTSNILGIAQQYFINKRFN